LICAVAFLRLLGLPQGGTVRIGGAAVRRCRRALPSLLRLSRTVPWLSCELAPLGDRQARTYCVYPRVTGRRGLWGKDKTHECIRLCQATGVPEWWFAGAESIGPLAEFEGADRWVESLTNNGIVLIGDAAASSDQSWGCGLSLTLWTSSTWRMPCTRRKTGAPRSVATLRSTTSTPPSFAGSSVG
jgi:hypothetical protein